LNRRISDLFLKYQYQLGAIHFSIDAATEETYAKVRPGGDLQLAVKNILYFLEHRSQIPPKLIFQFIVMKRNYHEARAFLEFWTDVIKKRGLDFQVNYDWVPEMAKDTIFFKRENPWHQEELKASEALHKKLAFELGLISEVPEGRILVSDECVK
jgi:wyosine [tRNA(Phe)-imidazoG37] synthetase (radical SAM superfamily)